MTEKSMVDVAYEVISKNNAPVAFTTIWNEVVKELGFNEEDVEDKISTFYTSLSLDGRFHNMGDNTWDLSSNLTFEQVNADIDFSLQDNDKILDDDSDESELEEELEDEEDDDYDDDDIDFDDDDEEEIIEDEEDI